AVADHPDVDLGAAAGPRLQGVVPAAARGPCVRLPGQGRHTSGEGVPLVAAALPDAAGHRAALGDVGATRTQVVHDEVDAVDVGPGFGAALAEVGEHPQHLCWRKLGLNLKVD